MSTDPDRHKEIIRRLFEDVWSKADFSNLPDLVAPQFRFHFRGKARPQTPDNLIQIVQRWKAAFPDLRFQVAEIVAEGDMASARLVYQGTHQREWKGIPASGRKIEVHEMMFFRFEDYRIVEVWEVADEFSQRQQLAGSDD